MDATGVLRRIDMFHLMKNAQEIALLLIVVSASIGQ